MADVEFPYALKEVDGKEKLLHISEVEKGADVDAVCLLCKEKMLPRQGMKQRHHFKHQTLGSCKDASLELLRRAALEEIQKDARVYLPVKDEAKEKDWFQVENWEETLLLPEVSVHPFSLLTIQQRPYLLWIRHKLPVPVEVKRTLKEKGYGMIQGVMESYEYKYSLDALRNQLHTLLHRPEGKVIWHHSFAEKEKEVPPAPPEEPEGERLSVDAHEIKCVQFLRFFGDTPEDMVIEISFMFGFEEYRIRVQEREKEWSFGNFVGQDGRTSSNNRNHQMDLLRETLGRLEEVQQVLEDGKRLFLEDLATRVETAPLEKPLPPLQAFDSPMLNTIAITGVVFGMEPPFYVHGGGRMICVDFEYGANPENKLKAKVKTRKLNKEVHELLIFEALGDYPSTDMMSLTYGREFAEMRETVMEYVQDHIEDFLP